MSSQEKKSMRRVVKNCDINFERRERESKRLTSRFDVDAVFGFKR